MNISKYLNSDPKAKSEELLDELESFLSKIDESYNTLHNCQALNTELVALKIRIAQVTAEHFNDYRTDLEELSQLVDSITKSKLVSFISNSTLENITKSKYDQLIEIFSSFSNDQKLKYINIFKDL
jgi:hypothetical protein